MRHRRDTELDPATLVVLKTAAIKTASECLVAAETVEIKEQIILRLQAYLADTINPAAELRRLECGEVHATS